MKSTFWFYFPLVFFVIKGKDLSSSEHIGKFLTLFFATKMAGVRYNLAIITIFSFIVTYFEWYNIKEFISNEFASLILLSYIDFSTIELYKVIQLFIATVTIGLYYYSDNIWTPKHKNKIPFEHNFSIKILSFANAIRNFATIFYVSSIAIFIINYFEIHSSEYLPHITKDIFATLEAICRYRLFG